MNANNGFLQGNKDYTARAFVIGNSQFSKVFTYNNR
jgi:hypothetical protein